MGVFSLLKLKGDELLAHGEDKQVRLVASFHVIVGEFFNALEAQLRIKKSVVRLRHHLRFTTPSFAQQYHVSTFSSFYIAHALGGLY
ncbi:MAG: DUF3083 family protein [Oceanospirillaceae bacterium]|nr:DUF3083 family protein [Oceanospirillaceae bacterium]